MLTLEEIAKLKTERTKNQPFKDAFEVPLGLRIVSDDFKNMSSIVGVCNGFICLSNPVIYKGEKVKEISYEDGYKDFLIVHPQQGSLMICGIPEENNIVAPEKSIIMP